MSNPTIEIAITYPKTQTDMGGWTTILTPSAAILALFGNVDTGGHAAIRLTDSNGVKTVIGLYPTATGNPIILLFGDTVVVNGNDANVFQLAETMNAQNPERAKSFVDIESKDISQMQYDAIVEFATVFQQLSSGVPDVYNAFESSGINCVGFVERCLTYAGIDYTTSSNTNAYTGTLNYWAPASLDGAFDGTGTPGASFLTGDYDTNVLVSKPENASLFGGADFDLLFGNTGDDLLDGGQGADKMAGGGGNDTYIVDNLGDEVFERPGDGMDSIISSVGLSLPQNVENGTLYNAQSTSLTGNNLNNILINLSDFSQILNGASGEDQLHAGTSGDTLLGGLDNDVDYLFGGAGNDVLIAQGSGNDHLWGGQGDDRLYGSTGDNTFHYAFGDGGDTVVGGGGNDTLDFASSGLGHPLTVSRSGNDIKFSYSSSDYVLVTDWFSAPNATMQVKLPNGRLKSVAEINAGFVGTTMGWTQGVFNTSTSDFVTVIRGLNDNFALLDANNQASWGHSFFGDVFGAGQDTGYAINGHEVYSWAAGLGNQYAVPGVALYADASWDFWSDGYGGINFVITSASAGTIDNGWNYSMGNPGGLAGSGYIGRVSDFNYSNPLHAVETTLNSFTLYDGSDTSSLGYAMPITVNDFSLTGPQLLY